MIIEKYNGNTLEIYDSIEELPVTRYQKYNLNVMIDAGIGSDFESVNKLIATALRYNEEGDKANVQNLLINMVNCYTFIIENTSPRLASFVCLLKSINGKPVDDLSQASINKIIEDLGKEGLTMKIVNKVLSKVKKNLKLNSKSSSPRKGKAVTL